MSEMHSAEKDVLAMLERREVITTDPSEASLCCGFPRDDDGFCVYRPLHPIFVSTSVIPPTVTQEDDA